MRRPSSLESANDGSHTTKNHSLYHAGVQIVKITDHDNTSKKSRDGIIRLNTYY